MPILTDLTGKRFDRWVVLGRAPDHIQKNGKRRAMWNCRCECGNTKTVLGDNLKAGYSRSCGCYAKEAASKSSSTHHGSKTKLHGVWCSMKTRCYNPNSKAYKNYGGRGIVVCDEWKADYAVFRDWALANGYKEGLTIDRVNNDKGYSPDNCKWVTPVVQANNRRSNVFLTFDGETKTISEWAKFLGKNRGTLSGRYHCGWDVERILTT